jgi:hypothetical protein
MSEPNKSYSAAEYPHWISLGGFGIKLTTEVLIVKQFGAARDFFRQG